MKDTNILCHLNLSYWNIKKSYKDCRGTEINTVLFVLHFGKNIALQTRKWRVRCNKIVFFFFWTQNADFSSF